MNKQNTEKRDSRACASSTGSNRAETYIPGTTIPKKFYITVAIDMKELLEVGMLKWSKIVKNHFGGIIIGALEQLGDYRLRHRIFKFYGVDPGAGFKVEYGMFWATTDDGTIQFLRGDFLPISTRAIDAEMDYLDGKLKEVDGVLKGTYVEKT